MSGPGGPRSDLWLPSWPIQWLTKGSTSASRVCDVAGLGRAGHEEHHRLMQRLRALAAVLGCLAVLAGGFMTVAAATAPSSSPLSEKSAIGGQPCSHCEDCGGTPCPAPTVACVQACMSVA